MQLNFLTEVVGTWLTWQRSELMLYLLLRMLGIRPSTVCLLEWLMLYSLMLLSLIRYATVIDVDSVVFGPMMVRFLGQYSFDPFSFDVSR